MELDDEICLCFHVTKRKVLKFIRTERVQRVGQLADCYGAGTGCGWCRPYLERLFTAAKGSAVTPIPTVEEYVRMRERYLQSGDQTGTSSAGHRDLGQTGQDPTDPL